jgi:predicted phage tail protein
MQDTDGLVAVHLHHPLSEKFGPLHHFHIRTPVEALRALEVNMPGFRQAVQQTSAYWIVVDGELRTFDSPSDPTAQLPVFNDVHFVPKVSGNAFLGPALIGAMFPTLGATATQVLGGLLVAGLLMGLSMLIAPKKKKEKEKKKDENYAFSGPENVTGQGVAVPVVYGRCHCTSVVVSASLTLGSELAPDPALGLVVVQDAALARALTNEPPPTDLEPPLTGWPPIIQTNFTPPRVGPQGWEYLGTVGKMMVVGGDPEKVEVEYFASPDRAFGWDRLDGFRLFNGRLVNW